MPDFGNARIEGLPAADWVLVDAGDVIVHVFRPEVRSFLQSRADVGLRRLQALREPPDFRPMRLHVIARGKIGRSPERELVDRYAKRIAWPFLVTELPDQGRNRAFPAHPRARRAAR